MSSAPAYVRIDWEADGVPYLAIARPGRPVERISLDRATVVRLVADGAAWICHGTLRPPRDGHDHGPPHYIGAWGE